MGIVTAKLALLEKSLEGPGRADALMSCLAAGRERSIMYSEVSMKGVFGNWLLLSSFRP